MLKKMLRFYWRGLLRAWTDASKSGRTIMFNFTVLLTVIGAIGFNFKFELISATQALMLFGLSVIGYLFYGVFVEYDVMQANIYKLEQRLSPKIKLYLNRDPFDLKTGIEIAKEPNGESIFYVQVCVKSMSDAMIYDVVPHFTKIEYRTSELSNFEEVISETLRAEWGFIGFQQVTLSKGKPIRFNIVAYNDKAEAPYDVSIPKPNKVAQFYQTHKKVGEYRYKVHVEGRDIDPAEAYVSVRWRLRGFPSIKLDPITSTQEQAQNVFI
jgi:hypothetical protein